MSLSSGITVSIRVWPIICTAARSFIAKELVTALADFTHRRDPATTNVLDRVANLITITSDQTSNAASALMSGSLRQLLFHFKELLHTHRALQPAAVRRRILASMCHLLALVGHAVGSVVTEVRGQVDSAQESARARAGPGADSQSATRSRRKVCAGALIWKPCGCLNIMTS